MNNRSPVSFRIDNLDSLLHGECVPDRSDMVRGQSGTRQTVVGDHCLAEGSNSGANVLPTIFEELATEVRQNVEVLGVDCSEIPILDLDSTESHFGGSLDDRRAVLTETPTWEGYEWG